MMINPMTSLGKYGKHLSSMPSRENISFAKEQASMSHVTDVSISFTH